MKRIYSTIGLCLLLSLQLPAQEGGLFMYLKGAEKRGDLFFEKYAYLDALKAYQQAYEKGQQNDQLKLKIAESYRLLNEPAEAEKWYSKIEMKEFAFEPEHLWYYAEVLNSTGQYREAEKWYSLYEQEVITDSRPVKKKESIEARAELMKKNADVVSVNLAPLNSEAADFSPAYYKDGLVFLSARNYRSGKKLFLWDKSAFLDLYFMGEASSRPEKFDENINSALHEGPVVFYQQGSRLIFTRNNYSGKAGKSSDGVTKLKLYYSERKDSLSWTMPEALPFNSDEFSTGHPAISVDGNTLYFASDRPGGFGGTDLYKVSFADGEWQTPENLGDRINTEGNELFPFLYQDQELYFASSGHGGLGGLDVFGVNLTKGQQAEVVNLGAPLNSQADDFGLILHTTGAKGYFSSNRKGGIGNDDVYSFTTSRSLLNEYLVSGKVFAASGGGPLEGVKVQLLDEQGTVLKSTEAGADGSYRFELEAGKSYQIKADKKDFQERVKELNSKVAGGPEWKLDLYLAEKTPYSLYALIRDDKTKKALQGVKLTLTNKKTGEVLLEEKTGSSGEWLYMLQGKKPQDQLSIQLKLAKEGYLNKIVSYDAVLNEPGQIKLHELMKFSLQKVDLGMDLGELAGVKAVYFDLGKHNIRPDAAAELDKVVAVMKENPNIEIELGSHTDARGASWNNLSLSEKRAKASADYIISQGIEAARVVGRGFGESELINRCKDGVSCSEEEHQQNRRTEFMVVKF